jgi:hypothetical protein
MPLTNYIQPAKEHPDLAKITGGMSSPEILLELERGGRFVTYQYVISFVAITTRLNSKIRFLRADDSNFLKSLPFTALTLLLGWWSIRGLIRTPQALYKNLSGGEDMTPYIRPLVTPRPIRTMRDLAD